MLAEWLNADAGCEYATVVARAAALVGPLRERAAEADAQGRLHDETIADLIDAGLHRICQPRRFGGYGLDPDVGIEAVMAVARGCGSSGWMANILMFHNWQVSMFPLEAQQEYWRDSRDVLCSTAGFAVRASIEPTQGGVMLSGQWKFASGADFADWFMLMRQGEGTSSWMLVPRKFVSIIDNWDVSGLRATGSKDIVLEQVFVPEHRMVDLADLEVGTTPGAALYDSPFYRVPFFAVAPLGVAAAVAGMAANAIDIFHDEMLRKRSLPSGRPQSEQPANHILMAKVATELESARLLLRHSMRSLRAAGLRGGALGAVERLEAPRNAAAAATSAARIASQLAVACGAAGTFRSHPMQRTVRDVLAGASHAGLRLDAAMEAYGKALWEQSPHAGCPSIMAMKDPEGDERRPRKEPE